MGDPLEVAGAVGRRLVPGPGRPGGSDRCVAVRCHTAGVEETPFGSRAPAQRSAGMATVSVSRPLRNTTPGSSSVAVLSATVTVPLTYTRVMPVDSA